MRRRGLFALLSMITGNVVQEAQQPSVTWTGELPKWEPPSLIIHLTTFKEIIVRWKDKELHFTPEQLWRELGGK